MNALIIGASAGLGRALAEELARRGFGLLLVASDERDLVALSSHLRLRYGVRVDILALHLSPDQSWLERLAAAAQDFGVIDALLFPIGASLDSDRAELDDKAARQVLETNFLSVSTVVSHFLPALRKRERAYIVGIGSIAAIRGRSSNVMYSAAKRALSSYFESLQHTTARTPIKVHYYQAGYLTTQQTFGKALRFPCADPEKFARRICDRLDGRPVFTYYPYFWRGVALLLRLLPRPIFNRLDF